MKWAVLLALLLAGCTAPQTLGLRAERGDLPARAEVAGVPFHPQRALECGPAALATALGWAGQPISPDALTAQVFSPGREGSLQADMVAGARRHGFLAVPVHELRTLLAEVAAGRPVLVLQNLGLSWVPQWHYAVLVGYDLDAATVSLRSGGTPYLTEDLSTFEHTWTRGGSWAQLVLAPGDLPAAAAPGDYVRAAAGFERTQRWPLVERAYAAAVLRWPGQLAAHIGLGNARYAQHDLPGAAEALEAAVQAFPEAAVAHNNLAHVLAELGRHEEALAAARRAVALGGPQQADFAATLAEVEARR